MIKRKLKKGKINRVYIRNTREVSAIPDTSLNMFYQAFSSA